MPRRSPRTSLEISRSKSLVGSRGCAIGMLKCGLFKIQIQLESISKSHFVNLKITNKEKIELTHLISEYHVDLRSEYPSDYRQHYEHPDHPIQDLQFVEVVMVLRL